MVNKIIIKLKFIWYRLFIHSGYKARFRQLGTNSYIKSPLKIDGYENIEIGNNVNISYKTWLAALPLTGSKTCTLKIGEGSCIGNFNHIYATSRIELGKNVLTADKVYISDNLHSYENIEIPVLKQRIKQVGEVKIGDGTWLGENVCVIGVTIGKQCVVGANAVVTKNIPDYSVAVGNPAKIIKRYCLETKQWKKTAADGKFIDQS
ncbi:MAG TPA: acyltransferase [Ferruginibacter sp.]|jgi:acetyltransferase-like isoleucine patch superfamily enzyme|nr:acyltransferase [Ferruginibacter sp.]